MRLYYNPDLIFKDIETSKIPIYRQRIVDLCIAIDKAKTLTQEIKDQFKFKKMRGTEKIFKFYLNNQDASRFLVMYEPKDSQVFESEEEPGLILLKAVPHHLQGEFARRIEGKILDSFERFLINEEDVEGDEKLIEKKLGREYLKEIPIHHEMISTETLLEEIANTSNKAIYKLSENQYASLNAKGTIFLMGSAGSGKTLVEICKALKNAHSPIKQAYFTFTPLLKETAEKLYKRYQNIKGLVGKTEFHILKNYFLDILEIPETKYFSFDNFIEWFKIKKQNPNKNYKFIWQTDPIDIWTEIRGILKGFLGLSNFRIQEFTNRGYLSVEEIGLLQGNGIIDISKDNSNKIIILDGYQLNEFIGLHNKFSLKNHLTIQDLDEELLDENSYVNKMKSHYSRFDRSEREILYRFVKNEYSSYLKTNAKFDDNDLARLLIKRTISSKNELKFDKVLVDEVQDLTEIQISALIHLCESSEGLFLAGDVSQVINPTFFHQGRLGFIFKTHFGYPHLETLTLNENYRNSENIVKVLDELLRIRRSTIGKYAYDIEEVSTAIERKDGLPILLNVDQVEIIKILDSWLGVPNVAIVVSSQAVKKDLIKQTDADASDAINIYTVQEIKGQEFDKVISYNMVSFYQEYWEAISNNLVKRGTDEALQYRFYFNTLYVALTRGRTNLYLYEEKQNLSIIDQLSPLFEEVKENALEITNVSSLDTQENRLKQADSFFQSQDYERAYRMYVRANNKKMAKISTGFHLLNNSNLEKVEEGFILLFGYKEYDEMIYRKTTDPELWLFRALIGKRQEYQTNDELKKLLEGKNIIEKLKKLGKNKHFKSNITGESIVLMGHIQNLLIKSKIEGIINN
jgi:superfamily I DNA/RNA helicase